MKKHNVLSSAAFVAVLAGMLQASDADPKLAMPANAKLEFAEDGNFLVNGKPRFLIGNLYYSHYGTGELAKGPGYGREHAWIYESVPDRDYLQRLGFDTSGGEVSSSWIGKYRDPRRYYQARNYVDWSVASNYWGSGLPMIVDFTCATWSHGGISCIKGKEPVERAFAKDCHFMYYSLVTPQGRDLWCDMWRSGAEELKANGAKPYAYELFNEPYYDDRSPDARKVFSKHLAAIWKGDVSAMNAAWGTSYASFDAASQCSSPATDSLGLGVEWHKFREKCFESGIRLGIKTIREVDPSARFCFQPLRHHRSLVSVIMANEMCEVTMAPTGGGTFYDDIVLRALSDGKPIVDGETYLGRTRKSHRSKLVTQWARGLNASYYFKWERRMREIDKRDPDGSLRRMGERFPWLGLNPWFVPPDELAGIMNAKRDIFAMQDLFAPRMRGMRRHERVATLFSMPTERIGEATGRNCRYYAETTAQALSVDSHVPMDAVFEEQLPSRRLDGYKLLVASGVEAVYDATASLLESWVKAGGTLVLNLEALGCDEWGRARASCSNAFPGVSVGEKVSVESSRFSFSGAEYDAVAYKRVSFAPGLGWEIVSSLPNGHTAVARRKVGKGCVYYIGVRFPVRGDEGRLLASIAASCGIFPVCRTLDYASDAPADGIEVHAARLKSGDTGFVVINTSQAPRAVRFFPGKGFEAKCIVDVSTRTVLGRDKTGAVLLALEPSDPVVLRGSSSKRRLASALAAAPAAWNAKKANGFTVEDSAAAYGRIHAFLDKSNLRERVSPFQVNPARAATIDIQESATAPLGVFLKNPPWGNVDCAGVVFDFIRPDQNSGRSCIALKSPRRPDLPGSVEGISVNRRAGCFYFLHGGIGVTKGDFIKYAISYADGTKNVYEAKAFRDFGDVCVDKMCSPLPKSIECYPGWTGRDKRGLWVSKWGNPFPEKTISSISVCSSGGFQALIAGISAELPPEGFGVAVGSFEGIKARPWGGIKADAKGKAVKIDFGSARDWAGLNVDWENAVEPPEDFPAVDFEFDLVAEDGAMPDLQVRLAKGKYVILNPFSSEMGDSRWRISVPLLYSDRRNLQFFSLQRRVDGGKGSAKKITIEGFRLVHRKMADNPLELRRFDCHATDGARAVRRDGGLELAVADNERHWTSLQLRLASFMNLSDIPPGKELVFEVNSGRTPMGMRGCGRQRLRVEAIFLTPQKEERRQELEKVLIEGGAIDDDPWTWQRVQVPFSSLVPEGVDTLQRFVMKLLDMPQDGRSGVVFRNLRFE